MTRQRREADDRRERTPVDPARRVAYEVLRAVTQDGAYANLALGARLRDRSLSARDRAFVTELVAGTVRGQGGYDRVIDHQVSGGVATLQPEVLTCLRLGAHQLLAMRVGRHAAVDETVRLCRDVAGHRPTGLVNAVLRKIGQRTLTQWLDTVTAGLAPTAARAVRFSHPEWVVEALAEALAAEQPGDPDAELDALLAANNEPPSVTVVARPGLITRDELAAELDGAGIDAEPTSRSPYGLTLAGGDPGRIAAVRDAHAGVQDEGSQLVALLAADPALIPDGPDAAWLDLCSGPGGKAALWAGLLAARSSAGSVDPTLVAVEPVTARAALVGKALAPFNAAPKAGSVRTEVVVGDGRTYACDLAFDRVFVDAPCSGLGALRRRPEARWRKRAADIAGLTELQAELLAHALRLVRPGGVVGYLTCTPIPAETRSVVADVLDRVTAATAADSGGVPRAELVDLTTVAAARDLATVGGCVQLWTHRHHADAMFLAVLRRL